MTAVGTKIHISKELFTPGIKGKDMPYIGVEVSITRKVETSESGVVDIDVPNSVIKLEEIEEWVSKKYEEDSDFAKKIDSALSVDDESKEVVWEFAEKVGD